MFQKNRRFLLSLLIIILILLSCRFLTTPSNREPISSAPTEPIVPTRTLAPQVAEKPAPTSLNSTGPFVLFEGPVGIWITNPDGSFPTRISEHEVKGDLHHAISPGGDQLALVTRASQGFDLVIVKIPSRETVSIVRLIDITPEEEIVVDPYSKDSKAFAALAIMDYSSVAWQPGNGRLLAFIGAIDGPTADLYLFDSKTQEITRLTNDPSQAVLPSWSPDGQYVLHYGVSWVPPFGGSIGNANRLDGVWSVQLSDGQVNTLPNPKGILPNFVGWKDSSHYLTYDSDDECYAQNIDSVDIVSGEIKPIMASSFYFEIAQSPETGALLFSSAAGCESSLGEGVFILLPDQITPHKLLEVKAFEIYWMPESKVFQAYPEALFSSNGTMRYDPPVYDASYHPAISKKGYQAWEVIENQQGRVVVKVLGNNWQTIMDGSVTQLIWDPIDGNTLIIALRDGSLYAASYPDFAPRLMGDLGGVVDQAIWLP